MIREKLLKEKKQILWKINFASNNCELVYNCTTKLYRQQEYIFQNHENIRNIGQCGPETENIIDLNLVVVMGTAVQPTRTPW
jgi:hypothetical protein